MDNKSLGETFIKMREQDVICFVDIKDNKEYEVHQCFYRYDDFEDKQVVVFAIKEKQKHDEK